LHLVQHLEQWSWAGGVGSDDRIDAIARRGVKFFHVVGRGSSPG
jgi:hypothetical protein